MREIKFRGLQIDGNGWVYGNLIKNESGQCCIFNYHFIPALSVPSEKFIEVYPETVGQFTGKKINGIELYDGDKIEMEKRIDTIKVVKYCEKTMSFRIANEDYLQNENTMRVMGDSVWEVPQLNWWETFINEMQIIGNIHENKI